MIARLRTPLRWIEAIKEGNPDLARGVRATVGMLIPLWLAETGWIPHDLVLMAIAAQSLAMVDLRGSYSLRLAYLFAASLLYAIAAALGVLTTVHIAIAVVLTGIISLIAGGLRHLSAEFGSAIAAPVTLIFLVAMSLPTHPHAVEWQALFAFSGALLGTAIQMALWPFRPQHPLRAATSEAWLAAADVIAALNEESFTDCAKRNAEITLREGRQREVIDRTVSILQTAGSRRMDALIGRLERLRLVSAQITTRAVALHTMVEAVEDETMRGKIMQSFQPMLRSLENLLRSAAITLVSRQPAHLAMFDVRLKRVASLIGAVRGRILAHQIELPNCLQIVEVLGQIECLLPVTKDALRETIDRASERGAFSLELTDLHTWKLGSLGAALNLSPRLDRSLARFVIRFGVVMMAGVFIFKWFGIPHGYWLPLTFVVVMQPDYGSTRQRAWQRVGGTALGSLLATGVLLLQLPHALLIPAVGAMTFLFAYFLKRRYDIAVVFVTLMVVLLTEIGGPVAWSLTAERIGCTLAGGILAMIAARLFWPAWEKDRFQPILATALLATRDYLQQICESLQNGAVRGEKAIAAKRRADTASAEVFASLRRMYSEPRYRQEAIEQAATLANGNQRLLRVLHLLMVHTATQTAKISGPLFRRWREATVAALEALAAIHSDHEQLNAAQAALNEITFPQSAAHEAVAQESWVFAQCSRIVTELSALLVAQQEAPRESGM